MLVTDTIAQKSVSQDLNLVTLAKGTTLDKISELFDPSVQNLSNFQLVILAIGHANIHDDKHFFNRCYTRVIDTLLKQNKEIVFVAVGLLPFQSADVDIKRNLRDKNYIIENLMSWNPEGYYIDAIQGVTIREGIPHQFLHNEQFNTIGADLFLEEISFLLHLLPKL